MRIFKDCFEAVKEVERDLFEMGTKVVVESMQDKVGKQDTIELRGYGYTIINPMNKLIEVVEYLKLNRAYISQENIDRINKERLNPGNAYLKRFKEWEHYLHDGKFSYTYSERIGSQIDEAIDILRFDDGSRQAIIQIYDYCKDGDNRTGIARIPCSMYYQLFIRDNKIHMIYTMRSCDFLRHFGYDLTLAINMLYAITTKLEYKTNYTIGDFTHFIGSLHAYKIDMEERGIF